MTGKNGTADISGTKGRAEHRVSGKAVILLFLLCLFRSSLCLWAFNQESFERHLKWFAADPYALFFKTDGGYAVSQALSLGIGSLLTVPDDAVYEAVGKGYPPGDSFFSYANELGGGGGFAAAGTIYGLALLAEDPRFQDAAFTSLQAGTYALGLTYLYKYIFGRVRPENSDPDKREPHQVFKSFSGHLSFPSGHTSTAFALVTPWFMYYPRWYTALLFAGAAGTAVARMGLEKHWSTDVLAGAGIGFFTGFFLSRLHMSAENEGFSIFPLAGKNSAGISAVYSY